jgi:hypothetical protein
MEPAKPALKRTVIGVFATHIVVCVFVSSLFEKDFLFIMVAKSLCVCVCVCVCTTELLLLKNSVG